MSTFKGLISCRALIDDIVHLEEYNVSPSGCLDADAPAAAAAKNSDSVCVLPWKQWKHTSPPQTPNKTPPDGSSPIDSTTLHLFYLITESYYFCFYYTIDNDYCCW